MTGPTPDASLESTWDRLRRRKVVQWGIAYVAGAWGLLQGLGYVTATFHWPEQFSQVATLALLICLPMVVVIAWYHGDRGEQRVTATEFAILTLLFLLGGGLFWRYGQFETPGVVPPGSSAAAAIPASARASDSTNTTDTRPSIAVLPFENRSPLADDRFFVDGIHDDILTQLARVSALKVIARTSVEQFRDTKLPMNEIGRQLGVAKVLEGGVQRAGDRVRINVQLIDAATSAHLWAESYDRELTIANIFAIQSEIAAAIATTLAASLTPAEKARVETIPTQSLEAWEAYQLGRQRLAKRTSAAVTEAESFFRTAIARDPKFALAYAGLGDALRLQIDYGGAPLEPNVTRAASAAQQALTLDPNSAEAWTAAAGAAHWKYDVDRADEMYRRAIALNPNYAPAHHWLSSLTEARGRLPEALRLAEKAVELDPLSAIANGHRASVLSTLARFEDARAGFARAIRIDPGLATAYHEVGLMHGFSFGELDEAVPWLEKAVRLDPTDPNNLMRLFMFYRQLGQDAEARRCLDRALEGAPQNSFVNAIAAVALYERGDTAAAREFAQKAAVNPRRIWLLRDDDLRKGDYAIARDRYSKAFPGLLTGAAPELTWNDFDSAIDLALVLQHTGERKRATNLLDRAEAYVRQFPRRGADGQGVGLYLIEEASIHALRGDKPRALALLREVGHAGWWRRTLSYHRDVDPNLESIRHEPEFKAIFANIEREMAHQRAKLAGRPENEPLDGLEVRRSVN